VPLNEVRKLFQAINHAINAYEWLCMMGLKMPKKNSVVEG
jgi:hypothetical protein